MPNYISEKAAQGYLNIAIPAPTLYLSPPPSFLCIQYCFNSLGSATKVPVSCTYDFLACFYSLSAEVLLIHQSLVPSSITDLARPNKQSGEEMHNQPTRLEGDRGFFCYLEAWLPVTLVQKIKLKYR
ncbi:hypothetical protein RRG08_056037 [Elysia crispata]|uniref:Uncharacterized protein n=1 Tax=Elysia crispata TaxID=231223 RepID=A0AAE1AIE7_9GAST|nr:hypothetical protein RRG08_056037 [Elysia crispata]